MLKNIKVTVETDEQNQYVLKTLQNMNTNCAWCVGLNYGCDDYETQSLDSGRVVCSVWKGFRYLVIEDDGELILCTTKEYYDRRHEKEITFQQFEEMVENKPKDVIEIGGITYKRVEE